MEIKGNFLYADSLMDLVVFDLSDLKNIHEVARLENVFSPYIVMPFIDDLVFDYGGIQNNPNEIIVNWKIIQERRRVDENYSEIRNGGVV